LHEPATPVVPCLETGVPEDTFSRAQVVSAPYRLIYIVENPSAGILTKPVHKAAQTFSNILVEFGNTFK